ncbi:protein FAM210B, mitochondrial isoform X2 [Rhinoraja longicauda]
MLPHFLLQSRQSLTLHKCLGRGVRVPWIGAAVRTGACPTSRRDHSHPLGAAPLHRPPAAPLHWPGAAPLHRPPAAPLHWPGAAPLHRPPAAPLHRPAAPLHWPGAAPLHWPGAAPLHWPGAAPLHWPPAAGRGLYTAARRNGPTGNEAKRSEDGADKKLNKSQQLKQVFKEYGAVGVVFHIGISLTSLGIFYLAVSSGVDVTSILYKMGFNETVVQSRMAAGTSAFVIAYAVHKVFAPVRMSITLISVPLLVRYFRKMGLFKASPSKP